MDMDSRGMDKDLSGRRNATMCCPGPSQIVADTHGPFCPKYMPCVELGLWEVKLLMLLTRLLCVVCWP